MKHNRSKTTNVLGSSGEKESMVSGFDHLFSQLDDLMIAIEKQLAGVEV